MTTRERVLDLTDRYITENGQGLITGDDLNEILTLLTEGVRSFKDEPEGGLSGLSNFIMDYQYFPSNSNLLAQSVRDLDLLKEEIPAEGPGVNNSARVLSSVKTLHTYLSYFDPSYFGQVTIADAKTILLLKSITEVYKAAASQPELSTEFLALIPKFGTVVLNTPVTRCAYLFYMKDMFDYGIFELNLQKKYMEMSPYVNGFQIQTPLEQVGRMIAIIEGGRMMTSFPEMAAGIVTVLGAAGQMNFKDNGLVQIARNFVISNLLSAVSNQPELAAYMRAQTAILIGLPITSTDPKLKFSETMLLGDLATGIAYNPEMKATLLATLKQFTNIVA